MVNDQTPGTGSGTTPEITYQDNLDWVDWAALNHDLAVDRFDNGRTNEQLEKAFANSYATCVVWCRGQVIGTARVLSDGVCNAYLVDVLTSSKFRRRGIAREMIRRLCERLEGQHIYLQADPDKTEIYRRLGFNAQPIGMSKIVGRWLTNPNPA